MFHHLVLFTQKQEAKASEINKALTDLSVLLESTQEVKKWSVDKVSASRPETFHYIQYTVFVDESGLEAYRNQPKHEVIKQQLKTAFDYKVIDY